MNHSSIANPLQILQEAVARSEMDLLLLGLSPYAYLPSSSPSPGRTDLAELLRVAYDLWPANDRDRIRDSIIGALRKLVSEYDGLEPVAACLLIETLRQSRKRSPMELPVADLSKSLSESIDKYREILSRDFSGSGAEYDDGRLGELRRISEIVKGLGGNQFVSM
jgi:hypothetical protein